MAAKLLVHEATASQVNCELPKYSTTLLHLQRKPSTCATLHKLKASPSSLLNLARPRTFGQQSSKPEFPDLFRYLSIKK
jgi:hypothetical protein